MISQHHPLFARSTQCTVKSTLCIATSAHYIVKSPPPPSAAAQVVVFARTVLSARRVEWEKCPVKTVVVVRCHMTCMCVTIVMYQNRGDCVNLSGMFT